MKLFDRIKVKLPPLFFGGLVLFGAISGDKQTKPLIKDKQKAENKSQTSEKSPTVAVPYRVDTLEKYSSILLYNSNGKIYRHYMDGVKDYTPKIYLFAHEDWHTHNLNNYKLSPQQYRKFLDHNEISANLVALNTLILEYSLSDNKKDFLKKYTRHNAAFSFYFKEIKKGRINPLSNDSLMREKDFDLRMNGTFNHWMERSYPTYAARHRRITYNYIQLYGLYDDHDGNYQKILKHIYFIGGVDFLKYLRKDIECNDILLIDNLPKVKSFPVENKKIIADIKKFSPLIERIQNDDDRLAAVQHLFIASEIKNELAINSYGLEPAAITILYNKIKTKYMGDESFIKFAEEEALVSKKYYIGETEENLPLDEFLSKLYRIRDVDLREKINNFDVYDLPCKKNKTLADYNCENPQVIPWRRELEFVDVGAFAAGGYRDLPDLNHISFHKPRRSDVQYIEIPNFREPLLINMTEGQRRKLKDLFEHFHNEFDTPEQSNNHNPVRNNKSKGRER